MAKLGLVLLLFVASTAAGSSHMDEFIAALRRLEEQGPWSEPLALLQELRRAAGLDSALIRRFLDRAGPTSDAPPAALSAPIGAAVRHNVSAAGRETGVALTSDGTTVALAPLLLGLEAGFQRAGRGPGLPGLLELTFTADLDLSDPPASALLGPDGCWDDVTSPRVFTLLGPPALLTDAQLRGAVDGVVLGAGAKSGRSDQKLSDLLTGYYCHQLDGRGLDAAPRLVSRRRWENFKGLVSSKLFARKVLRSVELRLRLAGRSKMSTKARRRLRALVDRGTREFVHKYLDCPPIIPRCMWGAQPYRGTPTNLSLPLSHLYVHHTSTPGQPCLSFQQCSADMRSMQRFHQEDRGWDDIGYSFVVGSDGHLYEGRGWFRQGAHTLGHNSIGYGVSFIGDYTAALPSQRSLSQLRDGWASCAVSAGHLQANFTLQGHRQAVNTSCPGDALYAEIQGWEHFGEVKN